MRPRRGLIATTCLLAAFGCDQQIPPRREPLSGKVTLKGAPLESGSIQFMPPQEGGQFGSGAVISNGRYFIPEEQGLPAGQYKVVISAGVPRQTAAEAEGKIPGESGPLAEERIPPEFNVNSDVIVEISANRQNIYNFDIP